MRHLPCRRPWHNWGHSRQQQPPQRPDRDRRQAFGGLLKSDFWPFNGVAFMLMTQNMASIPVFQKGRSVGTLAADRDQIARAIDALLSGI
jgi:hypothetical protein